MKQYQFAHWEDGSINPSRAITLNQDMTLTATYEEVNLTANYKFAGGVSAQAAANQLVTITVTKPDSTTMVLQAYTLADKTYSTTQIFTVAGTYKAKAHGDADGEYDAWDSAEATFVVGLTPRTGTLTVTLVP